MNRRLSLIIASLLAASVFHEPVAAFPERTVSMLVPFGPGGSTDLIARALAQEMSKTLGQQVVVVNKAGAGGAIGAAEVANARPDGHTLAMMPVGPLTTQPALRKLSYTPASFDMVCRVYSNPQVLLVRRDGPHRTLADLVADARRNPGKLNYASTGTGSVPHLALASLSSAASLNVVHVPYKGEADMLQGLLNGSVTMFLGHPTLLSVHAQTMRGIAVLAPQRLKEFPDMPTVGEQGVPPQHFEVWGGLVTPKGTPPAVLAALEAACRSGTAAEVFRKQLDNLNTPVMYQDAATFGAFVSAEFERNARLLREAGIKPE